MTTKRFFKKAGKITLYLLGMVLVIIIAAFIYINTGSGKNFIKNKLQSYLQRKLKTKIVIGSLDYSLPKWIELKNIYLEDEKKDTLLFGEQVAVDIDMLKLISANIYIRKVSFKNIFANISRLENDSVFNYQFVMNAFSGAKKTTAASADTAALNITLKKLLLNNIRLKFTDKYSGNEFTTGIKSLEANLSKFQPDRMQFDLNNFTAAGIDFFMTTVKVP